MVFCNMFIKLTGTNHSVTILILIDGFLQSLVVEYAESIEFGHNPYFNRWFSAIRRKQRPIY